jgi:hypothetical protein
MKKTLLSTCVIFIAAASFGQINSDDPIYNIHKQTVQTPQQTVESSNRSVTIGSMTINGEILPCDSTNTTLTVTGACAYDWFSDSLGANLIGSSADLPITLTSDTTVYIQAALPAASYGLPLPAHGSNYSSNVRGYWFQAQSDFFITGATVPTDASSGTSNIAILLFNGAEPPIFSAVANDFTTLGLWQNEVADTVYTCISVSAGDYIGVLGNRADQNSYAGGPYASTIEGMTTTLGRLGMQFPLSSTAPQDVWQEPGGSISRVELLISDSLDPASGAGIFPINIVLPVPTTTNTTAATCQGDSLFVGGAYQTTAGVYTDSLSTVSGCDSIVNTTLSFTAPTTTNTMLNACAGDSIFVGGALQTIDGIYTDTLANMTGCDSIVSTDLTFLAPFSTNVLVNLCAGDSVLVNGNYETTAGSYPILLSSVDGCDSTVTTVITIVTTDGTANQTGFTITANTAGATYQWLDCDNGFAPISGATSQSYTATSNGNYAVAVTQNGCTVNSSCFAITTIGIDEYDLGTAFSIYPNPTNGVVNYSFHGTAEMDFRLTDLNGKILWIGTSAGNQGTIDLSVYASGTYLLDITNGNKNAIIRLVKK